MCNHCCMCTLYTYNHDYSVHISTFIHCGIYMQLMNCECEGTCVEYIASLCFLWNVNTHVENHRIVNQPVHSYMYMTCMYTYMYMYMKFHVAAIPIHVHVYWVVICQHASLCTNTCSCIQIEVNVTLPGGDGKDRAFKVGRVLCSWWGWEGEDVVQLVAREGNVVS